MDFYLISRVVLRIKYDNFGKIINPSIIIPGILHVCAHIHTHMIKCLSCRKLFEYRMLQWSYYLILEFYLFLKMSYATNWVYCITVFIFLFKYPDNHSWNYSTPWKYSGFALFLKSNASKPWEFLFWCYIIYLIHFVTDYSW